MQETRPDPSTPSDGANTFTYDTRGRMTGVTTGSGNAAYQLNALGQRYAKTWSSTTTVYLYDDAGHLIAETSDGGTTYTEYLWLNDIPVAVIKPGSAALYYIHTDHLDTPRLIANQTPATVWRWDNEDPFGGNAPNENPSSLGNFAFNLRLPGQVFDAETSYHYNYFRDYSPEIGRYLQSDPIGIGGGVNTYGYANQNPLRFIDRMGLNNDEPFGGSSESPPIGIPNPSAQAQRQLAQQLTQLLKQLLQKKCPDDQPCDPPEGTQCYEGPDYGKPHAGLSPHYHIYEMQRKRSDGTCSWRYLGGKVGVGVLETLPAGMRPCSSYPNFSGRGSL